MVLRCASPECPRLQSWFSGDQVCFTRMLYIPWSTGVLYLNGLQVALHACELALKGHDPGQVVAQALGGLDHLGLLLHPRLDLVALQVVVLDVQG